MKSWLIVTPYFAPDLEYQEWVLIKGLARLGHRVVVLTKAGEATSEEAQRRLAPFPTVKVERLRCLTARNTFWPFPSDLSHLAGYVDGCVLVAPIHGFAYFVAKRLPASLPMTAIFSEFQLWKQPWLAKVIKRKWYRWLFARCQRLCATTPFGIELISRKGAKLYPEKLRWTALPFDEEDFFWPPPAGRPPRPENPRWLISPTRMSRLKPVGEWLRTVIVFLKSHPDWNYRMIGLSDDTLRPELEEIIEEAGMRGRVEIHCVLKGSELLEYYWDSALALYFRPSIGIQQALATGIPLVTARRATVVDHLIREDFNGFFYEGLASLPDILTKAAAKSWDTRESLSEFAMQWNSRSYVRNVLDV